MTAPFNLVSFANGLLANANRPHEGCGFGIDGEDCYACELAKRQEKCGGCSQPATRRDADDVADVCDYCGEASDDQKRDREKRLRRMAEREEI